MTAPDGTPWPSRAEFSFLAGAPVFQAVDVVRPNARPDRPPVYVRLDEYLVLPEYL